MRCLSEISRTPRDRDVRTAKVYRERDDDDGDDDDVENFFPAGSAPLAAQGQPAGSARGTFTRWVLSRTRRWLLFLSLILSRARLFYSANLFKRTFNSAQPRVSAERSQAVPGYRIVARRSADEGVSGRCVERKSSRTKGRGRARGSIRKAMTERRGRGQVDPATSGSPFRLVLRADALGYRSRSSLSPTG